MRDVLEVLFPYIFLLYVFDCITYVNVQHLLLTSLSGKKFALKRSGLRVAGWLPTSQTITTHNLPIYYTRDGIGGVFDRCYSNTGIFKAEDFKFIKFQDLESIEVEAKNIKLNNEHTIKTPSSSSARLTAEFINEIRILKPSDRNKRIRAFLSDCFDVDEIRKIETSKAKYFPIIKILSFYLFILTFFILPTVLYSHLSEYIHLYGLAICIFLFYFLLLVVTFLALKKLYPYDKEKRAYTLLSIIFSPVNAIHVLSYLTKDLYSRFNYIAIAAYFMPRESFKELVRKEIFLIDYFKNEIARRDWLQFLELKKKLLIGLIDTCEISLNEISTTPEKQDQTAIYYCPFCLTEYAEKRPNCIDCGMALQEFDKAYFPAGKHFLYTQHHNKLRIRPLNR